MTITTVSKNNKITHIDVADAGAKDLNALIKALNEVGSDVYFSVYGYAFHFRSRLDALYFIMGLNLAWEMLTDHYKLEERHDGSRAN